MQKNIIDSPLGKIELSLREFTKIQYSIEEIEANFKVPDFSQHGDITTNIALRLAKITKENPKQIAEDIKKELENKFCNYIEKIDIAGPGLINIFFSEKAHRELLHNILNNPDSTLDIHTENGKHWVIEHTSPNPNKAMHLGHLRNNLVGMSLGRILKSVGAKVTLDAVDNNRGIAIAKAMYGFLAIMRKDENTEISIASWINNKNGWETPKEKNLRPDVFVANCYVGAEKLLQEDKESNNITKIDEAIRGMVIDWENKDKNTWELWQQILDYSHAGMNQTLKRLGNHWDKVWHEHEHYQKGKEYVEAGLQKGIFKKLDDGAVLTQIEEKYGVSETILLKNDGTALYITQDIALTDLKKKSYNADKLLWVIGPDQSLAMQQLFCVCEELGIGKREDFIHIAYGYMGLKDNDGNFQKMSSRRGTVLTIDDLIDAVKEKLIENRNSLQTDDTLTEKLALAAIKFSILRCEKNLNMSFSIEDSININGDSGLYLLYTVARIKSILRTAQAENIDYKNSDIRNETPREVLRKLHEWPIVLSSSREYLSPHPIAHYLLQLASSFNAWYGSVKILDGTDKQNENLQILESVMLTMENGLALLGIESVERM
jgi:arginyl-tRNA synthetase